MKRISVLSKLLLVLVLAFGTTASAVDVDIELLLLNDVSGSIDTNEWNLIRNGYAAAFQSAAVQQQIVNNTNGVAVAFGVWSGATEQQLTVGWTVLKTAADANAFAALISGSARTFSGLTAPQSALNWAVNGVPNIDGNNINSTKQIIDIAGDGVQNDGLGGTLGRDAAIAAGVDTINGLVVGGDPAVAAYYNNNVKHNGTVWQVASFNDFAAAVTSKIFVELGGEIPEPGFVIPLALGIAALAWNRRKASINS